MTTTGLTVIRAAFELLNVFQPGESIPSPDAQAALGWLNRMLSGWAQQKATIPSIAQQVVPLVSGKATYTIGVGGDIAIVKPANQASIVSVGLLLGASVPPVEIPRSYLTDAGWQAIAIKSLTNSLFTSVYYNPTFTTTGLGTVSLWPVPLDATNSLVLYVSQALTQFTTLTALYQVPDGYEDALVYNLARRIYKPWGATLDQDIIDMAGSTLRLIKRSNVHLDDLPNDVSVPQPSHGYNIETGV